jgi:uroporphyrinogen-III synthase
MPMKVLITRAEPSASQTAKTLARHGHEAVVLPLFEVVDTDQQIPEKNWQGVIFTSRNAVEMLQKRNWKTDFANTPAYCVGEKTENAARMLGFEKTVRANGGGAELARTMGDINLSGRHMLYTSTPDKSFDMAKALEAQGVHVETIDIYQSKALSPSREDMEQAVDVLSGGHVFVYSALSSNHLAKILKKHHLESRMGHLTLIGISQKAVEPLQHIDWKSIFVSKTPMEEDMISLIK